MKARAHLLLLRLFRHLPLFARRGVVRRMAPQFTVGAICVIERSDGRVLLIRQSYRSHWGLPGGLIKRGEEAVDAVRREALEEVGIAIELVGEPTVVVAPEPRRVDVVFRARPIAVAGAEGAHPSSPEIVEVGWFDPNELPRLQEETAGAVQAIARASFSPAAHPLAR
ncbi:MAG: 8-oxo-dGTP diphosphatase [Thermoanaerobaculia bacterium]|nr:8-oxo-dGTP diphosphatase [Thermoanaerobaculia bacterium]